MASTLSQNLFLNGDAYSNGNTAQSEMFNLAQGGQMGWDVYLNQWESNQAYIRRQMIPILLQAPGFFQYMPNPNHWVSTLKALVELHAINIEGLKATLTVETEEHPVGGAGEMQEEVTNVTRDRTEVSFTWNEKFGIPVQTFLYNWIIYGLMDPNSKYPLVATLTAGNVPPAMTADMYSMTCLFMEPDPTHSKVFKSWITTNMFPKTSGVIESKRNLTEPGEMLEIEADFGGISLFTLGTNDFAQQILDQINQNLPNANPYLQPSWLSGIGSDVSAQNVGYAQGIETLSQTAVTGTP
jgi:hypothetical protein